MLESVGLCKESPSVSSSLSDGNPYKLADICRKAGVQPVFQQKTTQRGLLTRVKGPQKHMDKGVVYQIPCAQCDEVYIGETGRPLKTRISEQKTQWPQMMYRMPMLPTG